MELTEQARNIYTQIKGDLTKLGDIRKIAKEIKKNHFLAMELWNTANYNARMLSMLILDKKQLDINLLNKLEKDIETHCYEEKNQLCDWLMANQLMKDKQTILLLESWENNKSANFRRIFWYYQGRLRWSSKTPPQNAGYLLNQISEKILNSEPEVQWAMNFALAQIGINEPKYRKDCMIIGEKIGLYKGEKGSKGCTPLYAPEWIRIEVGKLNK